MHRAGTFDDRRAHLQGLDFLRGVAALIVVGFHFSSRVDLGGLFDHGYLAVDFFFILSGFVISRAYGGRLASTRLSFRDFVLLRLVRLLPLVVLGNCLAAAADLFRPGTFPSTQHKIDIAVTWLLGSLLLPTFWKTTLEQTTYPLNGPIWSLFFELVANIFYAALMGITRRSYIFSSLILLSLGILLVASCYFSNVHFGPHNATFALGFPRVFFSFFLGVLLSYSKIRLPSISRWLYAAVVFLALAVPQLHGPLSALFDITMISLIFPVVVLGAAQCTNGEVYSPISKFSGDISYPLYALHYPLVRIIGTMLRRQDFSVPINLVLTFLVTFLLALFSFWIFTVYDVPLRRALSRWIWRKAPAQASGNAGQNSDSHAMN
jgi:peptidoglycan/LPS O-acetylase OafA/YrhL